MTLGNRDAKQATTNVNALSDSGYGEGKIPFSGTVCGYRCPSVASKLPHAPESLGGLLKYKVLFPPPEFLHQLVWEEADEFASPTPQFLAAAAGLRGAFHSPHFRGAGV